MNFLLNAKESSINFERVRPLFISLIVIFLTSSGYAQVESPVKPPSEELFVADTTVTELDTLQLPASTVYPGDTTKTDSVQTAPRSDINTTINYSARDSIQASVDGKKIWLYGSAKIVYGDIQLEAEEVEIDYARNTLTAHGKRDSLGQRVGYPIFKSGSETYETKDIIYNFKTKKASITEVVTQQGEGIVRGEKVFKNERNELLSLRNSYTTCNLDHPHFRIRSTKSKAIPNDKIVSGPFYFEFNEIPLPIGLPFGMFPAQRESKSGIIFPSYGEERRRGFNLRGGGYFFDISDYIKLAVTGDIYSKGGHAVYINSSYNKRYHYNGSFNFSYSKTRLSDRIEDPQAVNDYRLTWSHAPLSKGNGRFSASVNAATSTYNKNNNLTLGYNTNINSTGFNNTTAKLSSNVSYSTRFPGTPFSLGVNLSHNQDLITGLVDLPLPNVSLNMTNLYPFQRKDGLTGPLDNFSVGYSMTATNRITNNLGRLSPLADHDSIAPFNMDNLSYFLRNGRKGIRHSPQVSYSTKFLKYFTLSPNISYNERWYFEYLDWSAETVDNKLVFKADTVRQFSRIANYGYSAGINTRLYGTFFFKQGQVKAIRHIVNPNVSFSYTPDFSNKPNYFQRFVNPDSSIVYKSRHEGFVYGSSSSGESGSISFGVGNNLEMKVRTKKDTVDRKVMLLNNLSINSSYNLLADSFKLAPFSMSANSNILDNLININLSASLDPYHYEKTQREDGRTIERRTPVYAWGAPGNRSLGRITSANFALSTNLNPKARKEEQESREKIANSNLPEGDKQFLINNPAAYIDFEIPWGLSVRYNLNYGRPLNQPANITQTLQFSGNLALSEKWKIDFNSGYDFENGRFTQTDFRVSRDLHCWTMSFSWIPFGAYTSYYFTINVKSSLLQDLKLERRKPFLDNL